MNRQKQLGIPNLNNPKVSKDREDFISPEVTFQTLSRSYDCFFLRLQIGSHPPRFPLHQFSPEAFHGHNVGCCLNQGDPQFLPHWGNTQKTKG